MASVTVPVEEAPAAPEWARKYPPMLAFAVALFIAFLVLPSSLNLPQTNPTTTLEYAPVPPEDQTPDAPPSGNFSSLGLGSSSGVEGAGASGGEGGGGGPVGPGKAGPIDKGAGTSPTTFRCVGDPPRQTEDPLSQPCVPFFSGDNFGATYQGVTKDEVRLLVVVDGGINYISGSDANNTVVPRNKYYDLLQAPKAGEKEHLIVKGLRGWQRYFNERFQTYGRYVHMFIWFSGCRPCTPEARRADAADNYSKIKPFAVLSFYTEGAEDTYLEAMARKGVLNFGSFAGREAAFFQKFPKLIWSYSPSIEQQADSYISYVCSKVANQPSVLAGPDLNNRPRKLGLIHTTDPNWKGHILMASIVKKRVEECAGQKIEVATFPECCLAQDNGDTGTYGQIQMADFKEKGVTTILWPGGINGNFGKNAQAISYYPEWVLLGDGTFDGNNPVRLSQNTAAFDGRAIMVTPVTFEPAQQQQRCYQAYREADTQLPNTDVGYICSYYKNIFQFFVGVQVAGPRLGPTSVDKGFHAIPAVQSEDVQTPSCYYLPNDYPCVKDGQAEI
ncbi:MAG: hypothetical protein ACR2H3_01710 [Acidimicrobiales bacterium]